MLTQFQNHIQTQFPFLQESKFFIAVSGGVDSMVLVDLFRKLQYDFSILHCNFNLRGDESEAETQFLKTYCAEHQIPNKVQYFDTESYAKQHKLSTQLAARELRYNWFKDEISKNEFDYLLTAHHLDDQVETFLINFTRGTGLEGLTGIPEQNQYIIRPLLPFSRAEILTYAQKNNVVWKEDSSNASDKYLRNKIRHDVIPVLKELNANFLSSFQNTLHFLNQSNELVQDASHLVYKQMVKENSNGFAIELQQLTTFKNYKSYLFQWLNKYGFTAWDDIYDLVTAETGKKVMSTNYTILKDRESLLLFKNETDKSEHFFITNSNETLKFPLNVAVCKADNILKLNNNSIFVDEDKIQFPLVIRKRVEGDYFYPSGMLGKKKVSKYYKDEKLSFLDKENQWLLTSNNEIVWIIGKRADQRFLADETTTKILKIELFE